LDELDIDMVEDEINKMFSKKETVYYNKLTGLIGDKKDNNIQSDDGESIKEEEEEEDNKTEINEDDESEKRKGGWSKYDGLSKKDRKQAVKDEQREKRKEKIPKHIKKKY
jgi:RIO kinase 1